MTDSLKSTPIAARLLSELRHLGPAVLDQGIWSIAGFASSAVVGRTLGTEGLGWFALGIAVLFGVGAVVNSLLLDPSSVIGPRDHGGNLRGYGGRLVSAVFVFGVAFALVGAAIWLSGPGTGRGVTGAAFIAAPFAFLGWTARRLPYVSEQPSQALFGSIGYVVAILSGLVLLSLIGALTPESAVLTVGFGSAVQAAIGLSLWRPEFRSAGRIPWSDLRTSHWAFGRWLVAAEGASWMLNYGMAAVSAGVIGLSAAGGFRASQILLRPYGIVFVGISLAYVPRLARLLATQEVPTIRSIVSRIGFGLSATGVLVFVLLLGWGGPLMSLIFGEEFREFGWLAAALSGAMVLHGWISSYTMALSAQDRTRDVFLGQAASAVTTLIGSLALGLLFGLAGFAATFFLATIARFAVVRSLYVRSPLGSAPTGSGL